MILRKLLPALILALLLAGCYGECAEPGPTAAATVPTTVPAETTAPETHPVSETTQPTEAAEPPSPWHSGIRPDGTFSEGTLFLGDSLTVGLVCNYLKPRELLGDARYAAISGGTLAAFHEGPRLGDGTAVCAYSPEYKGLRLREVIEVEGEKTTAVYIMLGTNYSPYADDDTYIRILSDLLESCPNATVYLQQLPMDKSERVNSTSSNARVLRVYEHFASSGEERVLLLDTRTAIDLCLAHDGIHVSEEGQEKWYQYLVDYALEHGIPE